MRTKSRRQRSTNSDVMRRQRTTGQGPALALAEVVMARPTGVERVGAINIPTPIEGEEKIGEDATRYAGGVV
jgi:hypothetical protein